MGIPFLTENKASLMYPSTILASSGAGTLVRDIGSPTPQEKQKNMSNGKFDADLVVIGSGPGGYVAAIKAAQLGGNVICVEKGALGGTCLNVGCIPSKVWIAHAERFQQIHHAKDMGITVDKVSIDVEAMKARVQKIVGVQSGGVGMLFKKNGVKLVEGTASFIDKNTIEVEKDGKKSKITGKNFLIATGSSVLNIKIEGLEGENIWTSDDAVMPPFFPESILIVGGGAVGVEFAYVFNALGCKTTVVEMMPNLIPMFDSDLGVELGRCLKKQGIDIITGSTLTKAEKTKKGWKCSVKTPSETKQIEAQVVLMAVGRKANTEGLNLEKAGVKTHKRGIEVVNEQMQTHTSNIYAIGDVIGKIQLAHVASMEGVVAAHNAILNDGKRMDYKSVPNVVYTIPEVASVGLTESEAKSQGYDVTVGKYHFRPNGKAMAVNEQDGFAKVVAEKKYGEVLGVHIIGAHATDLIHEGVTAIKLEATLDYMIDTIHAHPTLAEPLHEAFEAAHSKNIHAL